MLNHEKWYEVAAIFCCAGLTSITQLIQQRQDLLIYFQYKSLVFYPSGSDYKCAISINELSQMFVNQHTRRTYVISPKSKKYQLHYEFLIQLSLLQQ